VSDVSQGPGWWQAADGKWYSPEQVPGTAAPTAAAPTAAAPTAAPFPGAGAPAPYGTPPAGAPGGYGYAPVQKTNGLAVASLVCSFFFWILGIGAILAVLFGFIARGQIAKSNGAQKGSGLALAGIIIGGIGIILTIIYFIVVVAFVHSCNHDGGLCTVNTTN